MHKANPIPITVFTGFLGAGKTTIILSLLPQLPENYKVVLLKNEFGDIEVDSQLARQSSLTAVSEIQNGCMCCILVGQMKTALLEIAGFMLDLTILYHYSGSAFPATLALQIKELERETNGRFCLDAIITVIDAENFTGYEDKSVTAKMQAQYTDILLLVSERELDIVIDRLDDLNEDVPKIRCSGRNGVSPSLIFGIDSKLASQVTALTTTNANQEHNDEVETVTVTRNSTIVCEKHDHHACHHGNHDQSESLSSPSPSHHPLPIFNYRTLSEAFESLPKETIWRVKGFLQYSGDKEIYILNWAFGRYTLSPTSSSGEIVMSLKEGEGSAAFTVIGSRGETRSYTQRFANAIGASLRQ
ncbi:hypothetical protein Clacol_002670 [Clathrus columnatus]|uniref:CobW/HypB/UreG nucleotide-binding domain-containing protein n=1 Tax=Clathrus columnatus TaxID=1419009 RepID=A0AAV5A4A4_9AGAM|nr:hypothetical protein Clacol_002670 [Clathrus columnatus]